MGGAPISNERELPPCNAICTVGFHAAESVPTSSTSPDHRPTLRVNLPSICGKVITLIIEPLRFRQASGFFNWACTRPLPEGLGNEVTFSEGFGTLFTVYHEWINRHYISFQLLNGLERIHNHPKSKLPPTGLWRLIVLCCFAETLQDIDFIGATLYLILQAMKSNPRGSRMPSNEVLELAFARTKGTSPLRALLVDVLVSREEVVEFDEHAFLGPLQGFAVQAARELREENRDGSWKAIEVRMKAAVAAYKAYCYPVKAA